MLYCRSMPSIRKYLNLDLGHCALAVVVVVTIV